MITYKTPFITLTFLLAFAVAPTHASGVTYTYDALGRVLTATYDNGTKIFLGLREFMWVISRS